MTNETLLTTKDKLLWLPREFFEEVLKKHFYKVKSIFCFMCTILIVKGQEVKKKNIQMMRQVSERLTIFFSHSHPLSLRDEFEIKSNVSQGKNLIFV